MAVKLIEITDFSGGLNTRKDPLVLDPNESPLMQNVDITSEGAVITRFGYEKVCSVAAGNILGMAPYVKTGTGAFSRLCFTASDGHLYYITDSSTAPQDAGALGMSTTAKYGFSVLNNTLIIGDGTNNAKSYDGTTIAAIATALPFQFFEVFGGNDSGATTGSKMYAAGNPTAPSSVYFSDFGDGTVWSGGGSGARSVALADGTGVTGMRASDDNLFVFKTDHGYVGQLYLDSSQNFTALRINPTKLYAGCVAWDSAQVMFNDVVRLSDPETYGVCSLGFQQNIFTSNQRNNSLSWKIQPTIKAINRSAMSKAAATYFSDKYMLAAPTGVSSTNDTVFVYSVTVDGRAWWSTYTGIPIQAFSQFRNSQNKRELYFASALEGKIFKFNTGFNDDGGGYARKFRTKTFDCGSRVGSKNFKKLYVRGAISDPTKLKCSVTVDGFTDSFVIDKSYYELTPTGGVMGDNIYGDANFGGGDVVTLNRFMVSYDFSLAVNNGRFLYFDFENDGAGEPWKIDYIGFSYDMGDLEENYPLNLNIS